MTVGTDGDDIFYTILNGTGDTVVASTGLGERHRRRTISTVATWPAAEMAADSVIAYDDYNDNQGLHEININIRNNDGSFFDSFTVEWAAGDDNEPSVATLNDGGFVVAWHRGE